jgi:hypothetical protein
MSFSNLNAVAPPARFVSLLVGALHRKSENAFRQGKEIVSSLRSIEIIDSTEARGSVVGSGTMPQGGRSRVRVPMT